MMLEDVGNGAGIESSSRRVAGMVGQSFEERGHRADDALPSPTHTHIHTPLVIEEADDGVQLSSRRVTGIVGQSFGGRGHRADDALSSPTHTHMHTPLVLEEGDAPVSPGGRGHRADDAHDNDCAICQNCNLVGEFNTPPFFRRLSTQNPNLPNLPIKRRADDAHDKFDSDSRDRDLKAKAKASNSDAAVQFQTSPSFRSGFVQRDTEESEFFEVSNRDLKAAMVCGQAMGSLPSTRTKNAGNASQSDGCPEENEGGNGNGNAGGGDDGASESRRPPMEVYSTSEQKLGKNTMKDGSDKTAATNRLEMIFLPGLRDIKVSSILSQIQHTDIEENDNTYIVSDK